VVEAEVVNDEPEACGAPSPDVDDRDVLVVVEQLGEAVASFSSGAIAPSFLVDGFRRLGARGMSGGVNGTAGGGGEDKERSGTGAALTRERGALDGMRPPP
jgi:hypothetical protein